MSGVARDKEVLSLQKKMKELGIYSGALDGDFGPVTLASALKGFESLKTVASKAPVIANTKMIVSALPTWMDDLMVILEDFEAFRSKAYYDSAGSIWTIGIGTTVYPNGSKVKKGDVCTRAQAIGYAQHDVMTIRMPAIEKMVTKPLTDNQYAALISFCYNVGIGDASDKKYRRGFYWSKLRVNINAGVIDKAKITANFLSYSSAGGKVLEGLKRRRNAEAKLYFKAPEVTTRVAIVDADKGEVGQVLDVPNKGG